MGCMLRRYHGQFEIDRFLNDNFFHDKENGFFVECGAGNGVDDSSCLFFEENLQWNGLNIEASPTLFETLKNNRKKSININSALSNSKDKKFFYKCFLNDGKTEIGCGSLSDSPDFVNYLKKQRHKRDEIPIQINSLMFSDVVKEYNIKKIDLFVLDVEGHEIEALDGIFSIERDILPDFFCIEYGHVGVEILKKILNKHNYNFLTLCPSNINAIFKKETK